MFSNWWSWRWIIFVSAVAAQDAFPTTLSASPSNNVLAGTTVNLTCKFTLDKDNLQSVQFTKENGKKFVEFDPAAPTGANHGSTLSETSGGESQVWRTVEATFCNISSLEAKYGCLPFNKLYNYGSAETQVTLAGSQIEVSIGGKSCTGGSLSLGSEVVNVSQKINVSVSNERNPVTNLTLKINNDKVMGAPVVKDNTDKCAYAAEKTTDHTFAESRDFSLVYSYSSSGNKIEETCTVTINDEPGGGAPDKERLGFGVIFGIITGILLIY